MIDLNIWKCGFGGLMVGDSLANDDDGFPQIRADLYYVKYECSGWMVADSLADYAAGFPQMIADELCADIR